MALGVAWSDFTIREPSGNQQKTIRDLEAGWIAGWAALGWPGLATGPEEKSHDLGDILIIITKGN